MVCQSADLVPMFWLAIGQTILVIWSRLPSHHGLPWLVVREPWQACPQLGCEHATWRIMHCLLPNTFIIMAWCWGVYMPQSRIAVHNKTLEEAFCWSEVWRRGSLFRAVCRILFCFGVDTMSTVFDQQPFFEGLTNLSVMHLSCFKTYAPHLSTGGYARTRACVGTFLLVWLQLHDLVHVQHHQWVLCLDQHALRPPHLLVRVPKMKAYLSTILFNNNRQNIHHWWCLLVIAVMNVNTKLSLILILAVSV